MRPTALRAARAISSLTLLLAAAGCGDGKAFVEGRDAEREGKVHVAYEKYCRAAAEHRDSGAVAAALRRTIPRAAAHWESRGRIAERQRRTGEAWQMYMRALAIHPNDPFLADVIRGLEKDNETEIAGARLTWMRGGYPALAVAQVTEAPSVNDTAVYAARPQAERSARPALADAGHTDDANTSGAAAVIRQKPPPAIARNAEAAPALSATPPVPGSDPPGGDNPPPPARTNLADAGHTDEANTSGAAAAIRQEPPPAIARNAEAAPALSATPPVPASDPPGGDNPPPPARTNLADAGRADEADASDAAALISPESPPARTNLANALAWLDSLSESEHGGRLPDAKPAPEPPPVVSSDDAPRSSPEETTVGDTNVASPPRGRRASPEPSLDRAPPPPESGQAPKGNTLVVKDTLARNAPSETPAPPAESASKESGALPETDVARQPSAPSSIQSVHPLSPPVGEAPAQKTPVGDDDVPRGLASDAPLPPVESTEPSGRRPIGAPALASPRGRPVPRAPDYDVRSKPKPDGSGAGAVPAFLRVHTLSRRNHRYVKSIKTVDGVTIKLKDTDSEGDADLNLYYGHKRFKQVRDIRVGQASTFRGRSGRLFKMVILDIQHKSHTVRLGIKPA